MIPTNTRNKQLAKKKAKRKKRRDAPIRVLTTQQKYYLETVAKQKIKELDWRKERINLGLTWACGFDKQGNVVAVKRG